MQVHKSYFLEGKAVLILSTYHTRVKIQPGNSSSTVGKIRQKNSVIIVYFQIVENI